MICFPLDNTQYDAAAMGAYLATRTRGVFSAESNLAVTADGSGMTVSVAAGLAWLKCSDYWGTAALLTQAQSLSISAADGALSRLDTIVCRLNKSENVAELVVKKGSYASSPVVVDPVRNDSFDELYLATVSVAAGTTAIGQSMITDQRLNEAYCGLMRDGVTGIPTAQLQAQVEDLIDQLQTLIDGVTDKTQLMLKAIYDPDGKNRNAFAPAGETEAGMVTLSDATDSTSAATSGVAATPAAVKAVRDAAMPKAGGAFTGAVTLAGNPTVALGAVPKQYVDGKTVNWNRTLLWQNASPTSSFSTQTITLSQGVSNFQCVELLMRISTGQVGTISYLLFPVHSITFSSVAAGVNQTCITRMASLAGENQIYFDTGIYGFGEGKVNDSIMIPYMVYGINLSL